MNVIKYLLIILILFTGKTNYSQERSTLKLAMAQMLVEGGKKQNNLNRAVERIEEAAKNKADIILPSEAMDLGWTHSAAKTEAETIPGGSTFETLAKTAKNSNIYVCAGIIEKDGDRTFNLCRCQFKGLYSATINGIFGSRFDFASAQLGCSSRL